MFQHFHPALVHTIQLLFSAQFSTSVHKFQHFCPQSSPLFFHIVQRFCPLVQQFCPHSSALGHTFQHFFSAQFCTFSTSFNTFAHTVHRFFFHTIQRFCPLVQHFFPHTRSSALVHTSAALSSQQFSTFVHASTLHTFVHISTLLSA